MSSELKNKKCVPCEGIGSAFDLKEIHKYLKKVDGWDVKKNEKDSYYLEKKIKFKNFLAAKQFIDQVADISESENHHPDITFGWGYALIKIYTHALEGLSENDFILSAKIDAIKIND